METFLETCEWKPVELAPASRGGRTTGRSGAQSPQALRTPDCVRIVRNAVREDFSEAPSFAVCSSFSCVTLLRETVRENVRLAAPVTSQQPALSCHQVRANQIK